MESKKFAVYLVTYNGKLLPKFYLGSTSVFKIENGYFGSVKSIEYKDIWDKELLNNPNLFSIKILSYHSTRKEALTEELYQQVLVDAPNNPIYVNKSFACINGCFGVSKKSQWKGKSGIECPWFGRSASKEQRTNYSNSKLGNKNPAASRYEIYDSDDNLKFCFIGNIVENCVRNGIPANVANKLKQTIKTNSPISNKRNGITGPLPKFDFSYVGWYAKKILLKSNRNSKHHALNKIWVNDGINRKFVDRNSIPIGYSLGRGKNQKKSDTTEVLFDSIPDSAL